MLNVFKATELCPHYSIIPICCCWHDESVLWTHLYAVELIIYSSVLKMLHVELILLCYRYPEEDILGFCLNLNSKMTPELCNSRNNFWNRWSKSKETRQEKTKTHGPLKTGYYILMWAFLDMSTSSDIWKQNAMLNEISLSY